MASYANDSELGAFIKLPKEIRLEINSYLLPDDFRQFYRLDPVSGIANKFLRSSSLPAFFTVSSRIYNEMLQSLMIGRTCKIWIAKEYVTTNFPLLKSLEIDEAGICTYANHLQEDDILFPICQRLRIAISLPSPRKAEDFLQTRRNVGTVVSWLNACTAEVLPQIEVKLGLDLLDSDEDESGYVYNDFSMLVGPMVNLKKPCISALVRRSDSCKRTLHTQIQRQCCLIEKALNGSPDALKDLSYQQSMLDIKLVLCLNTFRFYRKTRFIELNAVKDAEIRKGVEVVRAWCKDYNENLPPWLDDLERVTWRGGLPETKARNDMLKMVLNGKKLWEFELWTAGLTTAFCPF